MRGFIQVLTSMLNETKINASNDLIQRFFHLSANPEAISARADLARGVYGRDTWPRDVESSAAVLRSQSAL